MVGFTAGVRGLARLHVRLSRAGERYVGCANGWTVLYVGRSAPLSQSACWVHMLTTPTCVMHSGIRASSLCISRMPPAGTSQFFNGIMAVARHCMRKDVTADGNDASYQ